MDTLIKSNAKINMACVKDGSITPLTVCSDEGRNELSGANIGLFVVLTGLATIFLFKKELFYNFVLF